MAIPKVELPANLVVGDGKPCDVATDFHLANAINQFYNYKSAVQTPLLWREYALTSSSSLSPPDTTYRIIALGQVFFGLDIYGAAVSRSVTLAPFFRSNVAAPNTGAIRVRLSAQLPFPVSGEPSTIDSGVTEVQTIEGANSSAEWSTQSTTYAIGEEKTLTLGAGDLFWGTAWLIVEKSDSGQIKGFSKFKVGARTVL